LEGLELSVEVDTLGEGEEVVALIGEVLLVAPASELPERRGVVPRLELLRGELLEGRHPRNDGGDLVRGDPARAARAREAITIALAGHLDVRDRVAGRQDHV